MKFKFNLQYFGEGGGDGTAATSTSEASSGNTEQSVSEVDSRRGRRSNPLANVQYGKQTESYSDVTDKTPETIVTTKQSENKATDFENLIKGEYKAEFDARVQNIINKRFGEAKRADEQMKSLQPMLEMLSQKYGTNAGDYESLAKAISEDDSYYEEEAIKKGLTVAQLKELKTLERENEGLREAQREAERRQQSEQIYSQWMEQAEDFNSKYGMQIDFASEVNNPDFAAMLKNGVSVEAAYKAVHFDEMIGGAMFRTAQNVTEKMANNIQSRSHRPAENGLSARASALTKTDVNSLTRKDREEIERRVARGDRIVF
mgnify:CR=1 FL=1